MVWMWLFSVFRPLGADPEPKVDFRMDESSDVPILEDRSSSPIDFPQEQWLVGIDIENIERYSDRPRLLFINSWIKCKYLYIYRLVVSMSSQRHERDEELTQQTQGHNATATEKPRYGNIHDIINVTGQMNPEVLHRMNKKNRGAQWCRKKEKHKMIIGISEDDLIKHLISRKLQLAVVID